MTVSMIEKTAALVLVDLQMATLSNPAIQPTDSVITNASLLAQRFRQRGHPVVVATIDGMLGNRNEVGSRAMALPEQMAEPTIEVAPTDVRIVRRGWSAFAGTALHEELASRGVTQVVLAGVATSFGIESTARSAYDLGYDVVFATDAMKDMSVESHDARLGGVFRVLGETGATEDILSLLG